jgi:hypothetical protein
MNISLEEQIEYMRGEAESYVPESKTRAMLEAILATLEAVKRRAIYMKDIDRVLSGLAPTKPEPGP